MDGWSSNSKTETGKFQSRENKKRKHCEIHVERSTRGDEERGSDEVEIKINSFMLIMEKFSRSIFPSS